MRVQERQRPTSPLTFRQKSLRKSPGPGNITHSDSLRWPAVSVLPAKPWPRRSLVGPQGQPRLCLGPEVTIPGSPGWGCRGGECPKVRLSPLHWGLGRFTGSSSGARPGLVPCREARLRGLPGRGTGVAAPAGGCSVCSDPLGNPARKLQRPGGGWGIPTPPSSPSESAAETRRGTQNRPSAPPQHGPVCTRRALTPHRNPRRG